MCGGGCGSSDVGVVRGDDADDLAHEEHGLGGEEHLVSHPHAPQVVQVKEERGQGGGGVLWQRREHHPHHRGHAGYHQEQLLNTIMKLDMLNKIVVHTNLCQFDDDVGVVHCPRR